MERRTFIGAVTGALIAAPWIAWSQPTTKVFRIGFLASTNPAANPHILSTLREGLRERGYVEGRNVSIEVRWTEGAFERLRELADELVRLKVDLIFAWGTPASTAAKQATSAVPIVFVGVADPVGSGLVASLARPGANITGTSNVGRDLSGKLVELLVQVVPGINRFAVLRHAPNASTELTLKETEIAARALGLQVQRADIRRAEDFEDAFAAMTNARAMGVVVLPDPTFLSQRQRIADLARQHRLPSVYARRENAEAGGLLSYGSSLPDQIRRATQHVDRILKGARPAELPVEEPTKFELVINMKTAKALGLTIPQALLLRADEVIQ